MAYPLQPAPGPLRARCASSLNFLRWAQYLETRSASTGPPLCNSFGLPYGSVSKPCTPVVHIKIAGKWMFIPLKMVSIGIDP